LFQKLDETTGTRYLRNGQLGLGRTIYVKLRVLSLGKDFESSKFDEKSPCLSFFLMKYPILMCILFLALHLSYLLGTVGTSKM
jgi:hypothetical protein